MTRNGMNLVNPIIDFLSSNEVLSSEALALVISPERKRQEKQNLPHRNLHGLLRQPIFVFFALSLNHDLFIRSNSVSSRGNGS